MATAKGSNHSPGSILSPRQFSHPPGCDIDLFRSEFFFVNENDFDEFFGTFTIYSKIYKLFIVYLALDRNGKLIKS